MAPLAKTVSLMYANTMSSILVTGANGFVGQHLITELLEHNASVIGIGGPQLTTPEVFKNIDYRTVDLSDVAQVAHIDFSDISGVIHLAGMAAVGPSFERPMDYIVTNVGIEINLFEAALVQGRHPRFLVISSGSLYDGRAALPLTESSAVVPSSPYAVSKVSQEQMALYYQGRGFECIIARPFNHIGPGQGPGFIVPDLAKQVIDIEKDKTKEVRVGNLDAQRDYTDVRDIARAYRLLLESGKPGELYNVCSGTPRSGHDILQSILDATQTEPPIIADPALMRPSDNPLIYGSHQKITTDTGWEPEIDFQTTITDVVTDWRTRD